MNVNGKNYRTIWMEDSAVCMIEQNLLPFEFSIVRLSSLEATCRAIRDMTVRGAGAIGAAAGYAMAQYFEGAFETPNMDALQARKMIEGTRPTARNLFYAVERVFDKGLASPGLAREEAERIANEDADCSSRIGEYGVGLIRKEMRIMTHCNAGWLAFVDYGTALSPIYKAAELGLDPFVYVGETRPRSQGARLTAWELNLAGIRHSIIPDTAAAWIMSRNMVDLVITGADRIARNGDTANKIGTLDRAVLAREFNIPFYIAAPFSTFDLNCTRGNDIPIELRNEEEVHYQTGPDESGTMRTIRVSSPGSTALNFAFDVTPARLITGFITEKGIIKPEESEILKYFYL